MKQKYAFPAASPEKYNSRGINKLRLSCITRNKTGQSSAIRRVIHSQIQPTPRRLIDSYRFRKNVPNYQIISNHKSASESLPPPPPGGSSDQRKKSRLVASFSLSLPCRRALYILASRRVAAARRRQCISASASSLRGSATRGRTHMHSRAKSSRMREPRTPAPRRSPPTHI